MTLGEEVWIGVDPGGKGNFGLAILKFDGSTRTCCVSCADEAVQVIVRDHNSTPSGVGVDAPLWWSSGRSSDRKADQWLRSTYSLSGGRVQTANSLRGAALVQGAMFVQRLRENFPEIGVTETHPKAVWKALKLKSWNAFLNRYSVVVETHCEEEHERDAVISAVAAREGFGGRWVTDLSTNRHPNEQDPSQFWLGPVHYYWPDK